MRVGYCLGQGETLTLMIHSCPGTLLDLSVVLYSLPSRRFLTNGQIDQSNELLEHWHGRGEQVPVQQLRYLFAIAGPVTYVRLNPFWVALSLCCRLQPTAR